MRTFNQKGFTPILLVVVVAFIAVGGFVAWRVYGAKNESKSTQQETQSTNTQPKDPNAGYVVIKEWGVRFKPVEGLVGVEYAPSTAKGENAYSFTTQELRQLDPDCGASSPNNRPLGSIERAKETLAAYEKPLAKIGEYYYYYSAPHSVCSTSKTVSDLQTKTIPLLKASVNSLGVTK